MLVRLIDVGIFLFAATAGAILTLTATEFCDLMFREGRWTRK